MKFSKRQKLLNQSNMVTIKLEERAENIKNKVEYSSNMVTIKERQLNRLKN